MGPEKRPARATLLTAAGAAASALCLLDPALRAGAWVGPLLATLGLALAARRGRAFAWLAGAAIASFLWSLAAWAPVNLGADSRSYFAALPSLFFDGDLDFGDEFAEWGYPGLARDNPLRAGWHPVGPAILWSPFYALAHVYVSLGGALGRTRYAADGLAAPYLRAAALGTIAYAVAGTVLLFVALRRRTDGVTAAIAVTGTVAASTITYYLLVQPVMAHGVVFGVACALVWALDRADEAPTRRAWMVSGALLGLLVLCRWQGVAAAALVVSVALPQWTRRRVDAGTLVRAAAVALAVFSPQLLAWKAQHGRWLTLPQGAGYVDWTSPHLVDVLLSADHGLLTWTPIAALGIAGLLAMLGSRRPWAVGALLTIALTAWVNGSVTDWAGSDAFGARRFDFVIPLFAAGVAVVVGAAARAVARHPRIVPAAALGLLAAWNLGLVGLQVRGALGDGAPLERVAAAQSAQLRHLVEGALGAVAGPRGRNLAYKLFVGEYLYDNVNVGGTIDLGAPEGRFLGAGWSSPRWREGGPRFRWALAPRACFRLPLQIRTDLPAVLTARAPRRLGDQTFEVRLNERVVAGGRLGPEWSDVAFTVPGNGLVPGENALCLVFAEAWGEEGQSVAAQVARLQLP